MGIWNSWGKIYRGVWRGILEELLVELGVEGSIILKWSLKKKGVRAWTGFTWLRLGSSGRIL
jgi:hypothetical protein